MFKAGQKVVCIVNEDGWYKTERRRTYWLGIIPKGWEWVKTKGPVHGDVCTVEGYNSSGYLCLKEWPKEIWGGYEPVCFRPLNSITEELALKAISEVVEERPEHINEPQPA